MAEGKFAKRPEIAEANIRAFKAGHAYGETTESFSVTYEVAPAKMEPGTYRNISGNMALSYGLIAASQLTKLPLFLGSYPITPASDILHELSRHKHFGVRTFQAEDEIAGIGAALGAAFGGALGVTTTSGPGVCLKSEAVGLAITLELPLLVCDIQRGGPSTGLPTKTEQADLLQAMFGRNGEAPLPVVAPRSPSDCFDCRDRGRAARDQVPHPGDPAVRRLPRQRLGAVEAADRRTSCPTSRCSSPPRPTLLTVRAISGPTFATRRRSPGPGPCRAPRASSTASAVWRRPTAAAGSPTPPRTTST